MTDNVLSLRERQQTGGFESFTQREALELLLQLAGVKSNAARLTDALLSRFGSLTNVLEADTAVLMDIPGVNERTVVFLRLILQLDTFSAVRAYGSAPLLNSAEKAGAYCTALNKNRKGERLTMLLLDASLRLKRAETISDGNINTALLDIQKVVNAAYGNRNGYAIFTHNHPSGTLRPSEDDVKTTQWLIKSLETFKVTLLDHIIVHGNDYMSMREASDGKSAPLRGLSFAPVEDSVYATSVSST